MNEERSAQQRSEVAPSPVVLVVDDDSSLRHTLSTIIRVNGSLALDAANGTEALQICTSRHVDLMFLDVCLPDIDGLRVLREVRENHAHVPVIMISVLKDVSVAVEAMKLGALDYVTKDFGPAELKVVVERALAKVQAERDQQLRQREDADEGRRRPFVFGTSRAFTDAIARAKRVADTSATVLLTGEVGTGKEALARYMHESSNRRARPFVPVRLRELSLERVDSTLFGHEKGGASGHREQSLGMFELAKGGTVFLDGVTRLEPRTQFRLLRALEDREMERVDGVRPVPFDVRVICATSEDLREEVRRGQFHENLFNLLNVYAINLSPLRERREDIGPLAEALLRALSQRHGGATKTFSTDALGALARHSWRGNICELREVVKRLTLTGESPVIEAHQLPQEVLWPTLPLSGGEPPYQDALANFERAYFDQLLRRVSGNRRLAAEHAGIGYSTLRAKLEALRLRSEE